MTEICVKAIRAYFVIALSLGCGCSPPAPASDPLTFFQTLFYDRGGTRPLLVLDLSMERDVPGLRTLAVYPRGDSATVLGFETSAVAWSPTGRTLAYLTAEGQEIRTRDSIGAERTLFKAPPGASIIPRIIWSPQGDAIGFLVATPQADNSNESELVVLDAALGAVQGRFPIPPELVRFPLPESAFDKFRWSPDGSRILISWDGAAVLEVADGRLTTLSNTPVIAEWTADGRGVYYLELRDLDDPRIRRLGGMHVLSLDDAQAPMLLADSAELERSGIRRLPFLLFASFSLSPSSRKIAIVGGAGRDSSSIRLYDASLGARLDVHDPITVLRTNGSAIAVEWNPDETKMAILVVRSHGVEVEILDLVNGGRTIVAQLAFDGLATDLLGLLKVLNWSS